MFSPITLTVFCIFFLSVLGAPLPIGKRQEIYGKGTWFYVGLGACGEWNGNSDPIVALSADLYGTGGYCNQWVTITNTVTGKQASGQVRDRCSGCGYGDLDMSQGLFEQFGTLAQGVLSIEWHFT